MTLIFLFYCGADFVFFLFYNITQSFTEGGFGGGFMVLVVVKIVSKRFSERASNLSSVRRMPLLKNSQIMIILLLPRIHR